MACFCGNSCCRCGARQNACGRAGTNAAALARETAERMRASSACPANTQSAGCRCRGCNRCAGAAMLADTLYGGRAAESPPVSVSCCDPGCCRRFRLSCRNPFWPAFAHPRWLCCRQLYCRRGN